MKAFIFLALLISCILCTSKIETPRAVVDMYEGVKKKIMACIANSTEISQTLKDYVTRNIDYDEKKPLGFRSMNLTKEERKIVRQCKRVVFKAQPIGNGGFTPIQGQVAHKANSLRKLSSLSSFNFQGIFDCLEYAQPAIKIVRDAVNTLRSKDYTTAIISLYDNFSIIIDALSYCYAAILPSD